MSKIKQLLQLYREGVSNRQIAKIVGLHKGTVNDYVRKIKENHFDVAILLTLDDPVLEGRFMSGTAAYTDKRFEELKETLPYIEKELGRAHVTLKLLWQEYMQSHPDGYRYTQFCYHVSQQRLAGKPSAVLVHYPGEQLFVDFAGDKLAYVDRQTGEIHKVEVFAACLPYSDYGFTMAVSSQTTADFLYALSCCLKALGGSPKMVVPDNLKAAVVKADKYEPELNRLMEDFANHYGFVVVPARVRKPQDKALVENQVKLIYRRVYAKLRNETFFSIEELNKAMAGRMKEHNQTRMQQKPYSRQEKFLAEEKQVLRELPASDFEIKYYAKLRVGQNNCIYLGRDKHYYSVPYQHTGREVLVVYTRTLVTIYSENQAIATHQRMMGYGYSMQRDHLCSTHKHYLDRTPEYYIQRASRLSETLQQLVERIFEGIQPPEMLYKRCDGLLSLQRKTDPVLFERACRVALESNNLSYRFVQRLIENKGFCAQVQEEEKQETTLPFHQNIRGREYYT